MAVYGVAIERYSTARRRRRPAGGWAPLRPAADVPAAAAVVMAPTAGPAGAMLPHGSNVPPNRDAPSSGPFFRSVCVQRGAFSVPCSSGIMFFRRAGRRGLTSGGRSAAVPPLSCRWEWESASTCVWWCGFAYFLKRNAVCSGFLRAKRICLCIVVSCEDRYREARAISGMIQKFAHRNVLRKGLTR